MNIELLLKVKEQILKDPERYNQDIYGHGSCSSAHCIAGWAIVLGKKKWPDQIAHVWNLAHKVLSLRGRQDSKLFSVGGDWPKKFASAYLKAKTPKGRARVAARRIDHFIKTGGRE